MHELCLDDGTLEDPTFYFVDVIFLVSASTLFRIIVHRMLGRELLFQSPPPLFRIFGYLPRHVSDADCTGWHG